MTPWWLRPTAEGAKEEKAATDPTVHPAASSAVESAVNREPASPFLPEDRIESRAAEPIQHETAAAPPSPMRDLPEDIEPAAPVWSRWNRDAEAVPLIEEDVDSHDSAAVGIEPSSVFDAPLTSDDEEEDEDDAEGGESEGGEAGEETEEAKAEREGGRKRSRSRRRGGRRRNGRAGAETGEDAPANDESAGGAVAASPAPTPSHPPAHQPIHQMAPAPPGFSSSPALRRAAWDESPVRRRIETMEAEGSPREIYVTVPQPQRANDEKKIALFCDLENIALGVRDSEIKKFDIHLVLERLLEKGKIIVKKAYADWERYSDYKRPFHEAAIELIDIPQKYYSGKNSADIKMVVDAMDLSYSKEHLDTFVLLSGDSDFSPLVSKLKENNKYVIGIGVKNSSSALLIDNCDEFIFYEDVWRDQQASPQLDGLNKKSAEAFSLMVESIQALLRENKDVLWGSMIKQTMQRKKPSFNEGYYGYSTFSEMLEDAAKKNIVKLKKDQRSGTYVVTGFAKE